LRFVVQIVAINLIAVMSSAARDLSDPVRFREERFLTSFEMTRDVPYTLIE
jgi:hypothetical protein